MTVVTRIGVRVSVTLDEVVLHHVGVEGGPVDEGDPERHGGEADLQAPGHRVHRGEAPGRGGVRGEAAAHHDARVHEVVEGEEADALVGHVDEPLDAEGVEGRHDVQRDARGHEGRHGEPVHGVGGARHGPGPGVPLAAVKQVHIIVDEQKLFLDIE